jgi:phytol kinase
MVMIALGRPFKITEQGMCFLIFFLIFSALFLLIDVLQKKLFTQVQWSRKATHVLSGVTIYFMPLYLSRSEIIWLAIIFTLVLTASKWRTILSLHNVHRKTLGEIFYPFSVGVLSMLCLPQHQQAFQIGILVLAFSDGMAGIIGEIWDFRPISMFKNKKSIGGSITFFIVTCIILFSFHGFSAEHLYMIFAASIILTAVEFVLIYGFDNLALPILTAFIELLFFN